MISQLFLSNESKGIFKLCVDVDKNMCSKQTKNMRAQLAISNSCLFNEQTDFSTFLRGKASRRGIVFSPNWSPMSVYGITFDVAICLDYLSQIDGNGPFLFSGPLNLNTQGQFNALIWSDSRPMPIWQDILDNMFDAIYNYYGSLGPDGTENNAVYNQAVSECAPLVHAHAQFDISGLTAALAAKASISSLATVATSGSYNDLSSKPALSKVYEGTTVRNAAIGVFKSVSVASGVAVFHLTVDGLSTGASLFPTGVIADSVNAFVSDATASYQMAYAFSNSNKTITVTTNKLTTANILTGILGQAAGNGSVVKLSIWGY